MKSDKPAVFVTATTDVPGYFNDNAVTNAVQTVGSSLGRPSAIVMGRLVRLGARMTF